ncbi:MAG: anhydro-N-acetylmuramic acid kinase [Bdellovibrionaceae bacterium]|nr:anhydro-N-acetylmuramic acid kinase [Pseudobdellovibrionaceae bacterium]
MKVVGIMSGTSLDGVDYVLCQDRSAKSKNTKSSSSKLGQPLKYLDQHFIPFKKDLRDALLKATANELSLWDTARLHYELGAFYAEGLKKIVKNKKWKFDLIGLHGQTVFHQPPHSTLQIGEPSFLKQEFKVPVVAQFRNMDIAQKGQGAPLAPFFHKALMTPYKDWAFQNIGGMGNVTYVNQKKLCAFDTGPGNILMDETMTHLYQKTFDKDGAIAHKGLPHVELVEDWLKAIPYFSKPVPKTCGRENMSLKVLEKSLEGLRKLSPEDQMATLMEFTVLSLKDQYRRFIKTPPQLIVVSGGGAKNKRLMQRMVFHFPQSRVTTSDELLGWPVDAIEGGAFAWLALKRYRNEAISDLPTVTGAKTAVTLGVIC